VDKTTEEHWRELSEQILTDMTEWRRSHSRSASLWCLAYPGFPPCSWTS